MNTAKKLSCRCCSNSCLFKGRWDALEGLSSSSLSEILDWDRNGDLPDDHVLLERLVGGKDWYQQSEGRSDFVRNLIELVRPVFCHHKGLLEAVLKTERIVAGVKGHDVQQSENAARSLAKRLLKSNRQVYFHDLSLMQSQVHHDVCISSLTLNWSHINRIICYWEPMDAWRLPSGTLRWHEKSSTPLLPRSLRFPL